MADIVGTVQVDRRGFKPRVGSVLLALLLCIGGLFLFDGVRIKAKAIYAQHLLEQAWARTLDGETDARPWAWADVWPVAKIELPRLDKSSIVLSGTSGQALAFGPGHLVDTPQAGEPGMAIYAAHRDTHFGFLKHIQIGDEVVVTRPDGRRFVFVIEGTKIVDANASGLVPDGVGTRIALVTCWPFNAVKRGKDRFVAIGVLKERSV